MREDRGAGLSSLIENMRRQIEARDVAECERLGITPEQLEARRDAEREAIAREAANETARRAQEAALERAASLPITDAVARMIVLDQLEETDPLRHVRAWLASEVPILVLCGTVGRGKTVAACWAVLRHGGRYMVARDFERLFAHRYGDDELAEQRAFMSAGLVVLDEIGREDTAEGFGAYMLDLVDKRQRSSTRTILIANMARSSTQPGKPSFEQRYPDPRLHSRLRQSAKWAATVGDDLRGAR